MFRTVVEGVSSSRMYVSTEFQTFVVRKSARLTGLIRQNITFCHLPEEGVSLVGLIGTKRTFSEVSLIESQEIKLPNHYKKKIGSAARRPPDPYT